MFIDSSAIFTNSDPASAIEYTATVLIPIFLAVRIILQAISPRLAINIFPNVGSFGSIGAVVYISSHVSGVYPSRQNVEKLYLFFS